MMIKRKICRRRSAINVYCVHLVTKQRGTIIEDLRYETSPLAKGKTESEIPSI